VGGLDEVLAQLRDLVEVPLKRPDIMQKLGLQPPSGVLLVGAPGTGKTLVVRSLAQNLGVNLVQVNAPELVGKYYGESEARLRQVFATAQQQAPAIIFMDEIDAIAPDRSRVEGEVEKRMVAQLLTLLDGWHKDKSAPVILLAATNRPDSLDPALRRPGRLDTEIMFPIPDRRARREILAIHTRSMPLSPDIDLDEIAELTAGCVGADLKGICQEAARLSLKRQVPDLNQVPEHLEISLEDFRQALQKVKPSVLRSWSLETPAVAWEHIGGLTHTKQLLQEAVCGAFTQAELYAHTRAQAPKGILLYGSPGTGKTLLAKAVATSARANFINLSGAEVVSKWVGASEQTIKQVFQQARQAAPCVLFIDEIDTLCPARGTHVQDGGITDRLIGQLLTELDGMRSSQGVLVIGATNRREMIDPALLRSGRLELHICVDLPDRDSRYQILLIHNRDRPLAEDVDLHHWAEQTEGWNGADLAFFSNRAAIAAIRRHQQLEGLTITKGDFETAFTEKTP
jgi:transitional endoplasmic reticulum ATPase